MQFVCFVWISDKKTANFALHSIKRPVFITEVESVYSAVRTESLYNTYLVSLKTQYCSGQTVCNKQYKNTVDEIRDITVACGFVKS